MRVAVAILVGCAAVGCGDSSDESSVVIELSSRITPLDRATLSVFGMRGAIVTDRSIADGTTLELPRRIRIEGGSRAESIRILAWGERAGQRVAFGSATAVLALGSEEEVDIALDAPPGDCDGDGVPDLLDGCRAIADPEQRDSDGDGVTDACTPGAMCGENLIANAGFETSTTGWKAHNGTTVTLAAGGHTGASAALVCKVADGSASEYIIDDDPPAVPAPVPGSSYRVDAWVRSDVPGSQTIDLRLGELSIPGDNSIDSVVGSVTASAEWQLVTALYTTVAPAGTAAVDVRFRVLSAADGSCFLVDDVCMLPLAPSCP